MSEKKQNENLQSEAMNTRWWESYLVRYLLGSIFGSICLIFLAFELDLFRLASSYFAEVFPRTSPLSDAIPGATASAKGASESPGLTGVLITVGLLGLGYCYAVSTPITVLHAARYGRGTVDAHSRVFWLGWAVAVVFGQLIFKWLSTANIEWFFASTLIAFLVGFWMYLVFRSKQENVSSEDVDPYLPIERYGQGPSVEVRGIYLAVQTLVAAMLICLFVIAALRFFELKISLFIFQLLVFGAPVFWIGLMQYGVLLRLLRDESELNRFYQKLFAARRMEGARDVRDTYTHLREHANSVFILLTELCVAAFLVGFNRATAEAVSPIEKSTFTLVVLCGFGLWVLPTVFIWSRANAMERFFAEKPKIFLGDGKKSKSEDVSIDG